MYSSLPRLRFVSAGGKVTFTLMPRIACVYECWATHTSGLRSGRHRIGRLASSGSPAAPGIVHPVPVGVVNTGSGVIILDVVHPGSKKILWYAARNVGLSWNRNTAVAGLFKNLREYGEDKRTRLTPLRRQRRPSALQRAANSEQH
jgi:hypothetical protein